MTTGRINQVTIQDVPRVLASWFRFLFLGVHVNLFWTTWSFAKRFPYGCRRQSFWKRPLRHDVRPVLVNYQTHVSNQPTSSPSFSIEKLAFLSNYHGRVWRSFCPFSFWREKARIDRQCHDTGCLVLWNVPPQEFLRAMFRISMTFATHAVDEWLPRLKEWFPRPFSSKVGSKIVFR